MYFGSANPCNDHSLNGIILDLDLSFKDLIDPFGVIISETCSFNDHMLLSLLLKPTGFLAKTSKNLLYLES